MIQIFAVIWLFVNGACLYTLRSVPEKEEEGNELIDEIEFMEKFTSYRFTGVELLVYFAVFLVLDAVGYYLAAHHVGFVPWTRWLFYAAAALLAADVLLELCGLYDIIRTEDHDERIEKLAGDAESAMDSGNWLSFLALGGKFLVSVALVLWTVFPRG